MQSILCPAFQCCTQYHAPKHRTHRFSGSEKHSASLRQLVQCVFALLSIVEINSVQQIAVLVDFADFEQNVLYSQRNRMKENEDRQESCPYDVSYEVLLGSMCKDSRSFLSKCILECMIQFYLANKLFKSGKSKGTCSM